MSPGYPSVALTEEMRVAEARLGSGRFTGPLRVVRDEPRDALTAPERRFVGDRDGPGWWGRSSPSRSSPTTGTASNTSPPRYSVAELRELISGGRT